MNPIAMTLVLVLTLGTFAWSASRRFRLMLVGSPTPGFRLADADQLWARTRQTLIYALGQRKMPKNSRYRLAGIAHMSIFGAFLILGLNSVLLWIRGFDETFDFWGLLSTSTITGQVYSLLKELSAFAAILGSLVFVWYRVVARQKRMSLGIEGLLILGIIITMMVADYMYVGGEIVEEARTSGEPVSFHWYAPFGSLFAFAYQGLSAPAVTAWTHVGFWYHSIWVLLFLNLLPFSKHFHVITAFPNVFAGPLAPKGQLPDVDDLEGKVERDEPIGVAKIENLSWKHNLDLYTCTECGRCSDNCPAYVTGKKLSPKHLTLALRDHLYDLEPYFLGHDGIDGGERGDDADKHVHGDPPEGYHRRSEPVDLVGDLIDPEVIWACTTCRACEEQCPVNISYVDKIVEMRRAEVLLKNEFPSQMVKAFQGMEVNGNPWNLPAMDRGNWATELAEGEDGFTVPTLSDHPDAEVVFWVGCAANYDDQAMRVAQATARLLHHADVDFAIMGSDATCTGDPARRAGNEYLFQILAEQNVEAMNGLGVDKKVVVTTCPHCFNALANEYPSFGGRYDVVHHTEYLHGLLAQGRLKPEKPVEATVTFHDSCYLGRYNGVYASPREVLASIPGVRLVEPEYWNKERGLCCGAGGAQYWKEDEPGKERVSTRRTLQLLETGADTVASACPFCMSMLTDSIKGEDRDDVAQLDVAQLLERSVDLGRRAGVAVAAEE
ncbi:MAG: (Fe-S)-binding protein [Sandaracinaceae bacterium]